MRTSLPATVVCSRQPRFASGDSLASRWSAPGVAFIVWALLLTTGCSTLTSLGLPLGGPHRLLNATMRMQHAAKRPVELPRELSKQLLEVHVVEPGDVLLVESTSFDSPARLPGGDQTVQPDGFIDLGKYGRLIAAGKTIDEIEQQVRSRITAQEGSVAGDDVSVRLIGWDSKVYYVLGEVSSPGAYQSNGRETVLDALVAAGDLTDRANRHRIVLSRPSGPPDCRQVLPICYHHIVQLGDTSTNYQLLPGDRIFVPSLMLWEDLVQTLAPAHFDKCPQCGDPQLPCFADEAVSQTPLILSPPTQELEAEEI